MSTLTEIALPLADPSLFETRAYVGGEWLAAGEAGFDVNDPYDGSTLARVPDLRTADFRRAIDRAAEVQPAWAARPAKERAAILRRWYDLMVANADDLAAILTAEQGKPLAEAQGRDRLRRGLHRVVRRGGQARLRRHHPRPNSRPAHPRAEAADRRRAPRSRRGTSRTR